MISKLKPFIKVISNEQVRNKTESLIEQINIPGLFFNSKIKRFTFKQEWLGYVTGIYAHICSPKRAFDFTKKIVTMEFDSYFNLYCDFTKLKPGIYTNEFKKLDDVIKVINEYSFNDNGIGDIHKYYKKIYLNNNLLEKLNYGEVKRFPIYIGNELLLLGMQGLNVDLIAQAYRDVIERLNCSFSYEIKLHEQVEQFFSI
jgi:hypothetical protein